MLNAPTAPENKTGYHFDHWENDADHSTFSFGNPVTGPLTIRAVYAPNAYTVKYDKNAASASGTTADSAHIYDQGESAHRKRLYEPPAITLRAGAARRAARLST